jgi:VanZ family protein
MLRIIKAIISGNKHNIIPGFLCIAITIVIFIVGLWPLSFHPKNKVEWLSGKKGIHFYGGGIVYSPELFNGEGESFSQNSSITIEIFLQPEEEPDKNLPRIISLYDGKKAELLTLSQWKTTLIIIKNEDTNLKDNKTHKIGFENALPKGEVQFITITSQPEGTDIYLKGKSAKSFPHFTLIDKSTKYWQLVIGNSPTGKQPWTGNILGLAIYNRSLREKEVFQHYQIWLKKSSQILENKGLAALYLFDEHYGTLAHNKVGAQHHLLIPETLQVLKKSILIMPWKDFRLNVSYLKDILVNIVGFIPFGYIFSIFLYNKKQLPITRIYLITILLGGGISLIIELLQAYLVTRSSQMIDLICNMLGTFLGIMLFRIIYHTPTLLRRP